VGRPVRRAVVTRRTRDWAPHSRLLIVQEGADWVLAYEARQLRKLAEGMGVLVGPEGWASAVREQSIFHESQFTLLLHDFERCGNRLGFAYFHGRPGTPGFPEFDACFDALKRRHEEIDRVQVTNVPMQEVVLETGIAPEKLHRIPIGIDVDAFVPVTPEARAAARRSFGVPESAFVVGSFQKDGVGWGEGLEPKLIKGPDVLLSAAARLRERVPELWFLLTGPSRGYVSAGLERLGIPYRHRFLPTTEAVVEAYHAIDVCIVASREEGGPKAVLESMATGIPLVTTRVGQAVDLVRHGSDGFMVDVEDADGLADFTVYVSQASAAELDRIRAAGSETARENSYESLRPRWRALLDGFVALSRRDGA
jgi:glycosyltransferase involved in cell wall biosynthesis